MAMSMLPTFAVPYSRQFMSILPATDDAGLVPYARQFMSILPATDDAGLVPYSRQFMSILPATDDAGLALELQSFLRYFASKWISGSLPPELWTHFATTTARAQQT